MNYIIKMHNGDTVEVDSIKAERLKQLLLQDTRPEYVEIDDILVKIQTIASVSPKKKVIF